MDLLYDDHYHRVVRFLMLNGASPPDAEDAAHEAFTESYVLASKHPARWQATNGKAAWIRTVALRKYRRPQAPAGDLSLSPDQGPRT